MGFDRGFFIHTLVLCLKGVPTTLAIVLGSFTLSLIPSIVLVLQRLSCHRVLRLLSSFYISIVRGTPMVLQIFLIYSVIPSLLAVANGKLGTSFKVFSTPPLVYALIVFSLHNSALLAEVLRAAILSIDKGQWEAALSLGLNRAATYIYIIAPQALRIALPSLCSLIVILVKESSLAFIMTVREVTAIAKIQAGYGYNYIEAYLDIFTIYLCLCGIIQAIGYCIEKRLQRGEPAVPSL